MKNRNKNQIMTLAILLVAVVTLSLGFAAFSNVLNISSSATVTPSDATFNVDFSRVSATTADEVDITPFEPTLNPTTLSATNAVINNDTNPTITDLTVEFTAPGQSAEYEFYAANIGEYNAYLTSINIGAKNCSVPSDTPESDKPSTNLLNKACEDIVVSIKIGNDEEITYDKEINYAVTKHMLAKSTSEKVIVTIKYKDGGARADGVFAVEFGDITLTYATVDSDGKINNGQGGSIVTPTNYVCKRSDVTTLHTETCNRLSGDYFCTSAGYATGATITYGNQNVTDNVLTTGDAFDCDVNGDGVYDPETERFYYLNSKDGNESSEYAVLMYYSNTTAGVVDNTSATNIAYDSSEENWHGPRTAIANLPTVNQWSNVRLSSTTRAITAEYGQTATAGGTLPTNFSYTNSNGVAYAARLFTAAEMLPVCDINMETGLIGKKCEFVFENTYYSSLSMGTYGHWAETPYSGIMHPGTNYGALNAWSVRGNNRDVSIDIVELANYFGVRPAIEVLKSEISY